ncbi:hypothetical protein GN956_G17898 [Arapaima gigas]
MPLVLRWAPSSPVSSDPSRAAPARDEGGRERATSAKPKRQPHHQPPSSHRQPTNQKRNLVYSAHPSAALPAPTSTATATASLFILLLLPLLPFSGLQVNKR